MRAQVVPLYFRRDRTEKFDTQRARISHQLGEYLELLPERALGDTIPEEADAVVFPEILGEAYERYQQFAELEVPIIILTSEFMTISMWDWEIIHVLSQQGVKVLAPYHIDQTKTICRGLISKRSLASSQFLIFQDNPGEGFQPDIFKCFYWWTDECTRRIEDTFGVKILRKSLKELGDIEHSISEERALEEVSTWDSYPVDDLVTKDMKVQAARYYLAVKEVLRDIPAAGIGSNCLNESHYSSTTPCLAWNLLFEREKILWACEGDIHTLVTKYILYHSLQTPVMMSNIYPVLMGMAALKHENIPNFPEILDHPEDHILMAHCGYFGLAPQSFSTSWSVKKKVLKIVNESAHMLDARFPAGPVTLAKLDSSMGKMMVAQGMLKGYVQYPGSDCLNGAIIKIADGHEFMKRTYSHHLLVLTGHHRKHIELIADIFNLEIDRL